MSEELLSPAAKADIQGFVTSGYGHLTHGAFLFFQIHSRLDAQAWLQTLLPQVTSATSWRPSPEVPKERPLRALNLAFTAAGLEAIGLSGAVLNSFPEDFRAGIASPRRSQILGDAGDSSPERWEVGGLTAPAIHLMVMLHTTARADLDDWLQELRDDLRKLPGIVEQTAAAQSGYRPSHDREPFGFFDASGQPQIRGIKGKGVSTGEFVLGYRNEYNYFPASPVVPVAQDSQNALPVSENPYLRPDYHDLGFNGTFVVYRKLQQDVAGFWRFLRAESLRQKGVTDPGFMIWLAAKMVGRWPSGAPLVFAPEPADALHPPTDDFLYAVADPGGQACPFGSHIRRTNPRDHIRPVGPVESLNMSARHRIMRRGRVFGAPLFDPLLLDHPDDPETRRTLLELADDGEPRGVHFFSVNASIKRQFEFVQQAWANNPRFNGLVNNRDPLVGDNDPDAEHPSVMIVPGRPAGMRTAPLPRFVTVRGGAYLFMPSVSAIRFLSTLK